MIQMNPPYNFANITELNDWVRSHVWGLGVEFEDIDSLAMEVDPIIEYYQGSADIDYEADYSLSINGVDFPVYADSVDGGFWTDDPDRIPVSTSLHYVFKINNETIIDKTIPIPAQPLVTAPDSLDFTQPITVSWTLARNAHLQFFYGSVQYLDHYDDPEIEKLLPVSARSYTIPANTFIFSVEDYDFELEEVNLAEQGNNLAWVPNYGYLSSDKAGLARGLAHWGKKERRKDR